MGRGAFSETDYSTAKKERGITGSSHVTERTEKQVLSTGKLKPSVDPANNPIRRSLMRFDVLPDGRWLVTVGVPVCIESSLDTTASMGTNVDKAMESLPKTYECIMEVLPGRDIQLAQGIFGDRVDKFILQRPQFEMDVTKVVNSLADLCPERRGGDWPEDPHYGLFGAAYLTDAYINKIGLKGYHFLTSDAAAHEDYSMSNLRRVFGEDVLEQVVANTKQFGWVRKWTESTIYSLTIEDVVADLLKLLHAFFIRVGNDWDTYKFWREIYGENRIITIPDTVILPQIEAALIGLTEGTLAISGVKGWLKQHGISDYLAGDLADQMAKIPLGAQADLIAKLERPLPKSGDIFAKKTDLWPVDGEANPASQGEMEWL